MCGWGPPLFPPLAPCPACEQIRPPAPPPPSEAKGRVTRTRAPRPCPARGRPPPSRQRACLAPPPPLLPPPPHAWRVDGTAPLATRGGAGNRPPPARLDDGRRKRADLSGGARPFAEAAGEGAWREEGGGGRGRQGEGRRKRGSEESRGEKGMSSSIELEQKDRPRLARRPRSASVGAGDVTAKRGHQEPLVRDQKLQGAVVFDPLGRAATPPSPPPPSSPPLRFARSDLPHRPVPPRPAPRAGQAPTPKEGVEVEDSSHPLPR